MSEKILFYVQHLLGIGHLVRSFRVARALADAGLDVTIASGGLPVPGIDPGKARLVQLPPLRAGDAGFSGLVDAAGMPLTPEAAQARAAALLALFDAAKPDALLLEAFPFGRRQMRFELLPLLAAAKARANPPLVVASVRDILQETRKAGRAQETRDLVMAHFDAVLVHGDPALARLEETFPLAAEFAAKVHYTGLVGPEAIAARAGPPPADVIVSAGGGAVGAPLLQAAFAARPLTPLSDARWLFLAGPNSPEGLVAELRAASPANVAVERFAPDLPARLAQARLSISQAGYNTAADIVAARCRAVFVPFAQGGETEQTQRAQRLRALGLASFVNEQDLTPQTLAAAIAEALAMPSAPTRPMLDGALRSAEIVTRLLDARPGFRPFVAVARVRRRQSDAR